VAADHPWWESRIMTRRQPIRWGRAAGRARRRGRQPGKSAWRTRWADAYWRSLVRSLWSQAPTAQEATSSAAHPHLQLRTELLASRLSDRWCPCATAAARTQSRTEDASPSGRGRSGLRSSGIGPHRSAGAARPILARIIETLHATWLSRPRPGLGLHPVEQQGPRHMEQ
jgi:hypothetical protein